MGAAAQLIDRERLAGAAARRLLRQWLTDSDEGREVERVVTALLQEQGLPTWSPLDPTHRTRQPHRRSATGSTSLFALPLKPTPRWRSCSLSRNMNGNDEQALQR